MKAQRLDVHCPICHQTMVDDFGTHLHEHSKTDLVDLAIRYYEDDTEDE